jgi:predicted nucleotidyltransferase
MKNREYITEITVVAFLSKIFIKYPEIIKVKLYGSRAKGNYKPIYP